MSLQAIKRDFGASDFQMGVLTGIPFALFYSFMGIPIAAWADRSNRRNVLALAVAAWSAMTAVFGMAVSYTLLFAARVGTAVGEAGGSPPSHSLISDYFPKSRRGTAFSIYALGVPIGTSLGAAVGGWGNQHLGWRMTFVLAGVPGIMIALIVWLTVKEPPRGLSDGVSGAAAGRAPVPGMFEVLRTLWQRRSFRHLTLAAALHSVVWYASGAFNNAFLQRSHQMSVAEAGYWIAVLAAIAGFGTFFGGFAADRLSTRFKDRRWYLWVPGLATLRMRSVATSLLLFVQTLIGNGLGPSVTGLISDRLAPRFHQNSLRYALVAIGIVNAWAALHYLLGSRTLRQDLEATERLATA